uniref:Uncharacterized protein n=1 Tax=uncultured Chloroflexota bacterium TaxID=166587 RepID=H5SBF3_9CHLR|nr:hypothetical protein HGMM_F07C06C11 [uncultured Chloroflexota bacterium]
MFRSPRKDNAPETRVRSTTEIAGDAESRFVFSVLPVFPGALLAFPTVKLGDNAHRRGKENYPGEQGNMSILARLAAILIVLLGLLIALIGIWLAITNFPDLSAFDLISLSGFFLCVALALQGLFLIKVGRILWITLEIYKQNRAKIAPFLRAGQNDEQK